MTAPPVCVFFYSYLFGFLGICIANQVLMTPGLSKVLVFKDKVIGYVPVAAPHFCLV